MDLPEHWSVYEGEGTGFSSPVVREFGLLEGGKMAGPRKPMSRPSKFEQLEATHQAELERLEAAYRTNVEKIERIYRDVFAKAEKEHAAEVDRLQGIIDRLIERIGQATAD